MTQLPSSPLYGVNLGGWLVLEKWMTPSLFDGYAVEDERGFMRQKGARERLRQHRDSFVAEDDLYWLSTHGVTAVRVPVGYWIFGDETPYEKSVEYLDWLVEKAGVYNLHVIIDLHRAPGAPDGHDTGNETAPYAWFDDQTLQEKTLEVLERIAKRYGQYDHVWGIEMLNEPRIQWWRVKNTQQFYRAAYRRMIPHMRPGMAVIYSDGFWPLWMNGAVRALPDHPVVMDVHFYHFSVPFDGWRTLGGHLRKVRRRQWLIKWLVRKQPIIIGEWSGVISGRKMRRVPDSRQRVFESSYLRLQRDIQHVAEGQFYWNYKTEHPGIWNYRSLVETRGVDASDR